MPIFGILKSVILEIIILKAWNHRFMKAKNDEIKKQKIIFLRFYLFTFRERGRQGEKEGEKH